MFQKYYYIYDFWNLYFKNKIKIAKIHQFNKYTYSN